VTAQDFARARVTLNSCTDGSVVGSATLIEAPSPEGVKDVTILLSVRNLPAGKHGVHIHEIGACTPTCAAAGSHLDLGPFSNNAPVTANHPYHQRRFDQRACRREWQWVHDPRDQPRRAVGRQSQHLRRERRLARRSALPDTYCADPADPKCAGGGRIACGVLERIQ